MTRGGEEKETEENKKVKERRVAKGYRKGGIVKEVGNICNYEKKQSMKRE